jgi:exodeoxyribonuclease VII large subunit
LTIRGELMQHILSVSEINRYIRELLSQDPILSHLWVKGEISNYKSHYSGHLYFTIKDEKSLLKCVMFKTHALKLKFEPENGMKVIIKGYVSVFERDGQYQLYVEEMQPDGIGNLHIAFEQLKRKLQDKGLFDDKYKKKIPLLPRSIGVITSLTGDVIRDIINVLNRRFPNYHLKIFPVQVQGESAPGQIARAIDIMNKLKCVDVIILARGGGSLEELWAFNEEIVARSIFDSKIPIISAVGHETDYTISDFVADLRAPTPSAAAELVLPEKSAMNYKIKNFDVRLRNSLLKIGRICRLRYDRLKESVVFKQPYNIIYQNRLRLDMLSKSMYKALLVTMESKKSSLMVYTGKLDSLSPLKILSRGYSIVKLKESGALVKSVASIRSGDILEINVSDGKINCEVKDVEEGE